MTAIDRKLGDSGQELELKKEINNLLLELRSVSHLIPMYDLEKLRVKLDHLLQKASENTAPQPRKFKFKSKPLSDRSTPRHSPDSVSTTASATELPTSTGKTLVCDGKQTLYQGLRDTSLTYDIRNDLSGEMNGNSSSLHLRDLNKSVVNFKGLHFDHGSVYVENARDCVIAFQLQASSDVQIRLFKLYNCKVYITRLGSTVPQTIILEECRDCQFHTDMQTAAVAVQDFSSIGKLGEEYQKSYHFVPFETYSFDTQRLKGELRRS
ncbi:LADA_0F12838g1_1 [Lachancea dasiensis]|uniref:LADA_0F12838g1_1 n=1 Tax=Lachancea dasiensis TaxID=1072105 RepID=A0A1G4JMT6_9SACH|nr:LADA_0F12838g1_1 [Lachancea dasiensis]